MHAIIHASNAAVVRSVLEDSGIVLATFSGHDHAPKPDYTNHNGILHFTHKVRAVDVGYSRGN